MIFSSLRETKAAAGGMVLTLGVLASLSVDAKDKSLPDIHSGIPLNKITFPADAWGVDFLKIYEVGPNYLAKDTAFDLLPPPANDSPEVQAEIVVIKGYQDTKRNSETLNLIHEENGEDPYIAIFSRAGRVPDYLKTEAVEKVLRAAIDEAGYFSLREKIKYQRARPIQLAPDLKLVISTPGHSSYPSGHATQSQAAALVLVALDPENKDQYMQLAYDVAQRREIAGLHYPSDSEAGRKLAAQVIEQLMKNDNFEALFQKAKASIVSH